MNSRPDEHPADEPAPEQTAARMVPLCTGAILIACVLVYVWEERIGLNMSQAFDAYGFIPKSLMSPQYVPPEDAHLSAPATVITAMFLHGSVWHLIGNMLYLWVFGKSIEAAMGHARFVLFYLVSGVAAAMTMAFMDPASGIPMVGASGAISGLLGAYLLLHPRRQIEIYVPIGIILYPVRIGAIWVAGAWFAMQLLSAATITPDSPGVTWWAHIGGFLAGMALTPFLKSSRLPLLARGKTR
ncbi:MAG: rhomboid family intramembrane serine protease [Rhizomicrobium sp.]